MDMWGPSRPSTSYKELRTLHMTPKWGTKGNSLQGLAFGVSGLLPTSHKVLASSRQEDVLSVIWQAAASSREAESPVAGRPGTGHAGSQQVWNCGPWCPRAASPATSSLCRPDWGAGQPSWGCRIKGCACIWLQQGKHRTFFLKKSTSVIIR